MSVTRVAPGVWRAGTRYVNWYLVDAGSDGVTVVDAGLPGYRDQLDPALAAIGRQREDVRALVLTHGHIDHTGMSDALAETGAVVHLHAADEHLARHPGANRTQRRSTRYLHQPGSWMFVAHAVRQQVTKPRPMPETVTLPEGGVVDVPGRPTVVHVPGHTAGSVAFDFVEHGVAFVGDALCTVSFATWREASPRLQSRGSNRDSDEAMRSLERLTSLSSRVLLPGHGGPWRDGVEAAVASARKVGCY